MPFDREDLSEFQLLTHFLEHLTIRAPEELEDHIFEGDVIEVYDRNGIQCYRSFNFFEICSYSLEDILSHPWWELYERNPFITRRLANMSEGIFSQNLKIPVDTGLAPHVVREIWSPEKNAYLVRPGVLFPLENPEGEVSYLVSTFRVLEKIDNTLECLAQSKVIMTED